MIDASGGVCSFAVQIAKAFRAMSPVCSTGKMDVAPQHPYASARRVSRSSTTEPAIVAAPPPAPLSEQVDYFRIDPRLGDDADFDGLVAACRARGVWLLLDGVFNHTGRNFPPVAQALVEGRGSAAEEWMSKLYDTDGVITADYFEGHDNLVTLNHGSPRVQQFVREVMLHCLATSTSVSGHPSPLVPLRQRRTG